MGKQTDYVLEFLAHMGVKADVRVDEDRRKIIVIETSAFEQRRSWIETWFTLVRWNDDYCYFHERPRGTGQTI